jgi:HTH-type transcriptional regulator, sugar sensing transcriptional regulator
MDKVIKDVLSDLGLNEKEIRFFLTNYQTGPTTINDVAKTARLERSTAYLIAQNLLDRGLLIEDYKRYKKTIITLEPKTLLRMLLAKHRQIGRHEQALQENLPELQAIHQASAIRPKVRTYEGTKGLLSVWKDILAESQEVLLWTNQETEDNVFSEKSHALFIQERIKKKIPMRVLAVNNKKGKLLIKNDMQQLRLTKLLPKNVFFSAETYIYGNKVATLDYNRDIIGVIIESDQIVQSHRAVFELTWKNLG